MDRSEHIERMTECFLTMFENKQKGYHLTKNGEMKLHHSYRRMNEVECMNNDYALYWIPPHSKVITFPYGSKLHNLFNSGYFISPFNTYKEGDFIMIRHTKDTLYDIYKYPSVVKVTLSTKGDTN